MTRIDEFIFDQENKTEFILHEVPKQLNFKILRAILSKVNSSCVGSLFPNDKLLWAPKCIKKIKCLGVNLVAEEQCVPGQKQTIPI